MSRMRKLLATATLAALAVLVPTTAASAAPPDAGPVAPLTWYWLG